MKEERVKCEINSSKLKDLVKLLVDDQRLKINYNDLPEVLAEIRDSFVPYFAYPTCNSLTFLKRLSSFEIWKNEGYDHVNIQFASASNYCPLDIESQEIMECELAGTIEY